MYYKSNLHSLFQLDSKSNQNSFLCCSKKSNLHSLFKSGSLTQFTFCINSLLKFGILIKSTFSILIWIPNHIYVLFLNMDSKSNLHSLLKSGF